MAVANTKSTIVTNLDATPPTMNNVLSCDGRLREMVATLETAAADDAASVYRFFRVHSSWRISSLEFAHDAVTGMSTADIGVYDTAADGGAVVTDMVAHFASAVDISSASAGFVDRTYEATATDISKVVMPLWERMGQASDPNKFYDICITATTNDPSAAVTITGRLRYVRPGS